MVSAGTVIVIAGVVILFFAVGGVGGIRSVSENLGQRFSGAIPSLQKASADVGSGASEAKDISFDQAQPAPATFAVTQTRKNAGTLQSTVRNVSIAEFQPELQAQIAQSAVRGQVQLQRGGTLLLDQPTEGLLKGLTGKGTAQLSTGQAAVLTEAKRAEIRAKALTPQEQRDVVALEARRRAAIERGVNPNVKLSGAELVLRKREQEEISKSVITSRFGGQSFVGGKLFANPSFRSCNLAGKCFD